MPDMPIMFSRRVSASRGLLRWIVFIEPSWPVFIACSIRARQTDQRALAGFEQDRPAARRHLAGACDARRVGRIAGRRRCGCCVAGTAAGVSETSSAALLAAAKINPIPQRRGPEFMHHDPFDAGCDAGASSFFPLPRKIVTAPVSE
jgi:hypothetical protein